MNFNFKMFFISLLLLLSGTGFCQNVQKLNEISEKQNENIEKPAVKQSASKVIQEIKIFDNWRTDSKVIMKLLTLKVGKPYNEDEGHRSWRLLQESGYFREMNISTKPDSVSENLILIVNILEREKIFTTSGASGYVPPDGLFLNYTGILTNPMGRGEKLTVGGNSTKRGYRINANIEYPWLFWSDFSLVLMPSFSSYNERLYPYREGEEGEYKIDKIGGRLLTYRRLGNCNYLDIFYGYEFSRLREFDKIFKELENINQQTQLSNSSIGLGLRRDARTKANIGYNLGATAEFSHPYLGSDIESSNFQAKTEVKVPFVKYLDTSVFCNGGLLLGEQSVFNRYFQEGDLQPKGFTRREAGSRGGNRYVNTGLQFSFPVLWGIEKYRNNLRCSLFTTGSKIWIDEEKDKRDEGQFELAWGAELGFFASWFGSLNVQYSRERISVNAYILFLNFIYTNTFDLE